MLQGKEPEIDYTGSKEDYNTLSFQLGEYIAKLQQLTFPKFGLFSDQASLEGKLVGTKEAFSDYIFVMLVQDLGCLTGDGMLSQSQADKVFHIFEENRGVMNISQGSLVHHDLADHNLTYIGPDLEAVFDWEAMVVGDPVLDLASCPTWGTLYPREEKLLEGFTSISVLPDDYEIKRDLYKLRTVLWKTVYCKRMDILTDKRLQRLFDGMKVFGL